MLLRRGNIARRTIGKFKVESTSQWTLAFELEPSDPINFVRQCGDAKVANLQCLEFDLGSRVFFDPEGLEHSDFLLCGEGMTFVPS